MRPRTTTTALYSPARQSAEGVPPAKTEYNGRCLVDLITLAISICPPSSSNCAQLLMQMASRGVLELWPVML